MSDTIICHVRQPNGKYRKYKCKNGQNFVDIKGKTYNAPKADNHEILDHETLWGRKRQSYYVEGQADAIPLSRNVTWKQQSNHDGDVDVLIRVTKAALIEANLTDLKANASLGGLGLIGLGLLLHHFFG